MKLSRIHHVAIITSDYKKAKDFYVNKLGFTIIRDNYRKDRDDYKLDLKCGDCELEIFSMKNHPQRVTNPEAYGLRHLAFYTDDIERDVKELNKMGIKTEPIRFDSYTGNKAVFLRDPDGLPIELHE
ncbi:MAG: VOC family protein [Eubacteriales bacterium]|nr:VOC family protein [Eubacteriales bacterium]